MNKLLLFINFLIFSCFEANSQTISPQDTVTIQSRSSWNAQPARVYKTHQPVRITVHHEGGRVLTVEDDARKRLKNIQTWCMGPERNWVDIPYHYLISPDGTVYEGRNVFTVGETNTDYDPTGHLLISFLGNYNDQNMNDHLVDVLVNLIKDFCYKFKIDPETISTHRDHCQHTNCPGKNLYPYFEQDIVKNKVKEKMKM